MTLLEGIGWYVASSFVLGAVLARIGYTLKKTRRSDR